MTDRSPGSTAEALVRSGRALRRVSPRTTSAPSVPRRALRWVGVLVLTGLMVAGIAPAAWAHGPSDPEIAAVMDRIDPDMPGVSLRVETTSLGSQFVLENPTPTEVTVTSIAGDPLFRVGPGGVLANFRSPDWYTSKLVGGDVVIPPRATDHGKPVWVRVSTDPSWGWFDHRLHDAQLTADQKAALGTLAPFGSWSVPLSYGDRQGTAQGHYEYRPPLGSFTPSLSTNQPAPGITLTTLPGNPTPGLAVDSRTGSEVVVLGQAGEPFLRLTPDGAEGNQMSPTWLAQQGEAAGRRGDPAAPPQWTRIGPNPQVSFTVPWADPDRSPAELYALSGSTDVKNWTVSLLVDGQRVDVPGVTTFNPADRGGISVWWWIGGSVVLLVVVLGGIWLWLRRSRSGPTRRSGGRPSRGSHRTMEKAAP